MQRTLFFALALAAVAVTALTASPVHASEPHMPGQKDVPYRQWWYPAQLPGGPLEEGDSPARPTTSGFLTLPFAGPHYVTSIFDHCNPNYVPDGVVCRWDGTRRTAGGFDETGPPTQDWLYYDGHDGIDYGLYYERVLASADGVVAYSDYERAGCPRCGFGLEVRIDHGNGITTRYGHLSAISVRKGQRVSRGQVIGTSGNSGASTGEHLHWGVYLTQGFVPVDPYGWAGSEPDPWPRDVGNLWQGGAPRFPPVTLPAVTVAVRALEDERSHFLVDWRAAGSGHYDVQVVVDDRPSAPWLSDVGPGAATFAAEPGHAYWFLVVYRNDLGWSTVGASDPVAVAGPLLP